MSVTIQDIERILPENSTSYCPLDRFRFSFLRPLNELSENNNSAYTCIYYGNYSDIKDFSEIRNCGLVLYSYKNVTIDSYTECDVIIIYDQKDYFAYIKKLKSLFEQQIMLQDISNQMLDIVRRKPDIQQLLNYGYSVLKNPVMFVDVTMQFVAASGTQHVKDEAVWEFTIKNGYMPSNYVKALFDVNKTNQDNQENGLIGDGDAKAYLNHPQLACKVISNHKITGYIKLLEFNHTISEMDKHILILLSKYLSIVTGEVEKDVNISIEDKFIQSVIEGRYKSADEFNDRKNSLGIKFYEYFQIINIERNDITALEDRTYYIMKKIRQFFKNHTVIRNENYFIVLYNTKEFNAGNALVNNEEFLRFLRDNECHANFSYCFSSLFDMPQYYQQTLFCSTLRNLFLENRPVLLYEDIIEYHMLIHFGQISKLEFLIHPVVLQLQEIDRRHGSNYLDTLFKYLKHSQNLSATADAMFIHYNTLRYRINRIVELTKIDFNDSRLIFLINISERILNILSMQNYQEQLRYKGSVESDFFEKLLNMEDPEF